MNILHLDPMKHHEVFQKLIQTGRISAQGHIGTHLDCYTSVSEQVEYDIPAYVVDCMKGIPDTAYFQNMPSLQDKALILHTGNTETNGYGTDAYFAAKTFLSDGSLKAILDKEPLFIIIDSHGLGESGKKHISIDKACEACHCHVIENADLSSLKGAQKIRIRIIIDAENPSTGKPCQLYWDSLY